MHPIRGVRVLSCGLLLVVTLGMPVAAQDEGVSDERYGDGPVAIQAELSPLGWAIAPGFFAPSFAMGARFYPVDRFGIDVLMGLGITTGVEEDTARNTSEDLGRKTFQPEVGVVGIVARGKHASLGVTGRFGMLIDEVSAYDYAQVSPGVWEDHREPYWTATKRLYFGVEPSATGGGGFEFYAGFGLAVTFVPNSKYVDDTDPDYDPMRGDYPLEERRDAYTDFSFSGFTVGIRFRF